MHITPDHRAWHDFLPHLPEGFVTCNALITEKIPPTNIPIHDLLEKLAPEGSPVDIVTRSPGSDYCYIRLYLGRHSNDPVRLQDVKVVLHWEQMNRIELSIPLYTVALADALAFLLWQARVDADRVEFLFGPSRYFSSPEHPPVLGHFCDPIGWNMLWLLHFGHCREIPLDERGVDLAAEAYLRNEPYFPRPGGTLREEKTLWDIFRDRFLLESQNILKNECESVQELPRMFTDKITKLVKSRQPAVPQEEGEPKGLNDGSED